ncbi:cation channel sperm-associated auxiliary subunit epsilon-like [Watersipora subatra]|uniref:cation channel sperm-associated auxiliary subunit epsilon-like n=1 Tax=Watersipora subatra TaxID=2589382 RepID=UPI00355B120D
MVSLTIVAAVESELVTWRFTRPQRHGSSSTTRDTLELEFLGANTSNINDDDLLWTAPTCILSHNKGKHGRPSDPNHQLLKVWIYNDEHASDSELSDSATSPSYHSRLLTIEYQIMGQMPKVIRMSWLSSGPAKQRAKLLRFERTEGYWLFAVDIDRTGESIRMPYYSITGHPIALYSCFVRDGLIASLHISYKQLTGGTPKYYMAGKDTQALALLPNPCHANIALVIVREKVYITQDDFATITLLPAPEGFQTNLNVTGVAMMFNYIIVLGEQNDIYYLGVNDSMFQRFNVPAEVKPNKIASHSWCVQGLYNNVKVDLLTMTNGSTVWVSNSLRPPTRLKLPMERLEELAMGASFTYEVLYVSLDILPGRIGIAIRLTFSNENKVLFAIHDYLLNTWDLAPFWVDFKTMDVGRISFYFLGLAKSSFYFRNERNLFYSYDDSKKYGLKHLHGCSKETKIVEDGEHIRDVIVSKKGDLSILLSTNQILFGKVKNDELIMLNIFENPSNVNVLHWFDDLNNLWFIKVYANNSVTKMRYPLRDELQEAIGFTERCPYRYFIHNIQNQQPMRALWH